MEEGKKPDHHKGPRKKKRRMSGNKMGDRGVTRPMGGQKPESEKASPKPEADGNKKEEGQKKQRRHHAKHGSHRRHQGHRMHMMSPEERMKMLEKHHKKTQWVYWMLIILGVWVMIAPFTLGYDKNLAEPSGGRSVWLDMDARIAAMTWSDIISGLLLIIFGWRSLLPNRPVSLWICCFVGIWLNFAPLLFWCPSPAGYLNDTLTGALVIALSILIPGMPNMIRFMKHGPESPPGWSYNPSSWPQRWIMIVTGFLGWIVSRYLASYQLGYIDTVWDPFFGAGSVQVLDSAMSQSLFISDAGLGALAYTFEFLMGWMGSTNRWRTMPWMVTIFGILVIPLGLVHIFLVISQPLAVGHWCTFCLLAAAIMLPMIPLEFDEVIAMGEALVKRTKGSFWNSFWKGTTVEGGGKDQRSPEIMQLPKSFGKVFNASVWGMSAPWTLVVSTVIGIWLMAAPETFGLRTQDTASDINHLCGSLIVVFSVISMGEVVRTGRFLNIPFGLAVAILPWLLAPEHTALNINGLICGLLVAGLAIPRGPKKETYGIWDKYVK